MQIDWVIPIAQVVNFLILLTILKHFLFDRIVAIMDERERRITSKISDAENINKEAVKNKLAYEAMIIAFRDEKEQMALAALAENEKIRDQSRKEIQDEKIRARKKWLRELQYEKDALLLALGSRISGYIFEQTAHVLQELGDDDAQKRVCSAFIKKIYTMNELEKMKLSRLSGKIEVHSSVELSEENRNYMEKMLRKLIPGAEHLLFSIDQNISYGLEIRIDDFRVTWTMESYRENVMHKLNEQLKMETMHEKSDNTQP